MAGTSFDATRNSGDGFVAAFSRDLGTLDYATYIGGTADEFPAATSIRALDDNSFIVGFTAEAALPAAYISAGSAQTTFGGGADMWLGKFTNLNSLNWGTYVGGSSAETFNDLEVFSDGRVAFCGFGVGSLTEVASAAGRSTGTDEDGIIGILKADGSAFNYLDEIGGTGGDRINDFEIVNNLVYWTGVGANGFPVSGSGVYQSTYYGGISDVVLGK
ncbi:MAG: hypothetical protein IPJ83_07110 [Saprospiraceae bacterium]|nr:hypothetical protein [Candidatus Vicinibacter proximus]